MGSLTQTRQNHRSRSSGQHLSPLASEQALRREAEAASRAKDLFLALVSHELRTPLSAILCWTNVLSKRVPGNADLKEGMAAIERSCRVQVDLIEDLLDLSRITSGTLKLQIGPCELIHVINEALDMVRPAARSKGVRLEANFDAPASPVLCDALRMQQVVCNLLSNAVKFSPAGTTVRITLTLDDTTARIRVSDQGMGISPELLPHVFELYRRAEGNTNQRRAGLGLGLYLVKQLVEAHGGRVTAESEGLGRGATFTIDLLRK